MTCERREPRADGAPETEWRLNRSGVGSVGDEGDERKVSELLHLGREAFEVCRAPYLTVSLRLVECGRPLFHPYPHRAFATNEDIERAPYRDPLPDEAEALYAEADRAFDVQVWSR